MPIQPLLEPFEQNLGQNSSITRLFQPTLGSKSALGNWTLLALIKGAKLDTKIGLYFTHQNNLIFRAKTDLSDLQCTPDPSLSVFNVRLNVRASEQDEANPVF